jgi:hypothetical protein
MSDPRTARDPQVVQFISGTYAPRRPVVRDEQLNQVSQRVNHTARPELAQSGTSKHTVQFGEVGLSRATRVNQLTF